MAEEEKKDKKKEEEGKEFHAHAYVERRYGQTAASASWQQWINGILGLWLIVVALIGLSTSATTLVVTGIVIAIVGFWGAAMRTALWQQWVNAILGLWTIAIPFIGLSDIALGWTVGITGLVIAVLGFWATGRESA